MISTPMKFKILNALLDGPKTKTEINMMFSSRKPEYRKSVFDYLNGKVAIKYNVPSSGKSTQTYFIEPSGIEELEQIKKQMVL